MTIENVLKDPKEDKYRRINLENNAYKKRVGNVIGGKVLMEAIGFVEKDGALYLEKVEKNRLLEFTELIDNALATLS